MKKINTISSYKISRLLGKLLYVNNFRDTSFCGAIAVNYDETVLKIFINTIEKSHIKRLTFMAPTTISSLSLDFKLLELFLDKVLPLELHKHLLN